MKKPRRETPNNQDALPAFIEPAIARAADTPPNDPAWVHEIKHDGYRVQIRKDGADVALLTRRGLDWTSRFPGVARAFGVLPATTAIIDGEMIVEDEQGVSNFAALVNSIGAKRWGLQAYVAFDLMHLDGQSLLAKPLEDRKERLAGLLTDLPPGSPIRFGQHLAGDGRLILDQAARLGVEGIVSKRLDRPYRSGRSEWIKVKLLNTDEFVIVGYLPHAATTEAIGSLVLAFHDGGNLVYAGRVGTGFTQRSAGAFWHALQPLRTTTSPLSKRLDADQRRDVVWVAPQRVVEVAYMGWTTDRHLRAASFKGLREDKPARDVTQPANYPA